VHQVDQIYHLACPASPPHYQYNPIKTIKTSTQGTINMLGLARRTKARLLLASTSEACGVWLAQRMPGGLKHIANIMTLRWGLES
jgi:nucleoside-diphosphate-sugar epimerase